MKQQSSTEFLEYPADFSTILCSNMEALGGSPGSQTPSTEKQEPSSYTAS